MSGIPSEEAPCEGLTPRDTLETLFFGEREKLDG